MGKSTKRNDMQRVLVLDKHKNPLMPCTPARARILLSQHKAAVFKMYPNISTKNGIVQGINYRYCRLLQKNDGYHYSNHTNQLIN